jgi:hypothetical protein
VEPNLRLDSIFRHYNIGIYARVSTGSTEQLHSLGTQVSAFIQQRIPDGFLVLKIAP